jgi:hypothetical protein
MLTDFSLRDRTIVAGNAFLRCSLETAADVAGGAVDAQVGAGEWISCREMIEPATQCRLRMDRTRESRGRHQCHNQHPYKRFNPHAIRHPIGPPQDRRTFLRSSFLTLFLVRSSRRLLVSRRGYLPRRRPTRTKIIPVAKSVAALRLFTGLTLIELGLPHAALGADASLTMSSACVRKRKFTPPPVHTDDIDRELGSTDFPAPLVPPVLP